MGKNTIYLYVLSIGLRLCELEFSLKAFINLGRCLKPLLISITDFRRPKVATRDMRFLFICKQTKELRLLSRFLILHELNFIQFFGQSVLETDEDVECFGFICRFSNPPTTSV